MYNSHVHLFTLDHVPDRFLSFIPISWLKRLGILKWAIKRMPKSILGRFEKLERLASMLAFGNLNNQEEAYLKLCSYYPRDTVFAVMPMDMEFMGAGAPSRGHGYLQQLEELQELARRHPESIYPFVCADPRRPGVEELVINSLQHGCRGIKLYPALGFYPFDHRLLGIYEYACRHGIPVTAHCSLGAVYYRGGITDDMRRHPVTGEYFKEKDNRSFTAHYTDPVNYGYLLNPAKLQKYLDRARPGAKAPDLSDLKICLAHFGGEDAWYDFLYKPWNPYAKEEVNSSWLSTIRDLMKDRPNVYADISYMLGKEQYYGLLKTLLQQETAGRRILYGTDYYLVEQETSERAFAINLRGYVGDELFNKMARENPQRFFETS